MSDEWAHMARWAGLAVFTGTAQGVADHYWDAGHLATSVILAGVVGWQVARGPRRRASPGGEGE